MKRNCSTLQTILILIIIISAASAFPLTAEAVQSSAAYDGASKTLWAGGYPGVIIAFAVIAVCILGILLLLLVDLNRKGKSLAMVNKELENSNELIGTFIDADSSFVYLKDENLKYVFVNKALKDFYKLSYDEIIGYDDFELADREFAEICTKADLDALAQNKPVTSTTSQNNRFFRTTKFPVRMLNGAYGVGAYISDITEEYERHQARDQMLKRNKLLLEALSHSFQSRQQQLDYVLHELLQITESGYGYIFLYSEEKEEFVINSWTRGVMEECDVQDEPKVYKLANTGIWGEVVRQRRPIIINDFDQPNPLKKGYPQGHVQLARFMSVPVFVDEKIVATVGFGNKETDYDEAGAYEIAMLMSGVWNAVQRREAAEKLVYERNKYYQTLLSIGDGVMVVDRNKNIEFLNPVASSLTGWEQQAAAGVNYKDIFVLSHEQEGGTIEDPIEKVFATEEIHELGNHAILTSRKGARYHIEDSAAPIPDDTGSLAGVVLVFRNVTEKKEQRRKIEYMSFHDSLTGLYNRRFFEEELRRLDNERNLPISILLGDVNGLKLTNDIFGHAFGDMLLEKVAGVMQSVCRADDIIARWGGDEFVLLLPKTSAEEAGNIVERIKKEVSAQQIRAIGCSLSIDYDTKSQMSEDIMRTLSNAEARMYSAKTLERSDVQRRELNDIINVLYACSERERRHALHVRELCRKLGAALKLSEQDLQRLAEAGRLHDIGKIVLCPDLLKKDYTFTARERNEIDQHPAVGYRILNYFDETSELAETVLAHHERWDGAGYPKGLRGERIPLFARILSIAEAYDRMVHAPDEVRSRSRDEAAEEIRRCAGTQFDPDISRVFVELLQTCGED